MNKKILMTGNEAVGEAAISAGCRFYAGYPITPQNELTAYMAKRMLEEKGVFIQSESELAAINMVFGSSAVGKRAMTSSSSPGISLKQEGISYLAGCELPAVIVNVMRGGPGLGNIAPSQADYFQSTRGGGHGDYRTIALAPAYVQEAAGLTQLAFDLADKYRNPALVVMDGLLGQMMEPVEKTQFTDYKPKLVKKPWALTGAKGRRPNIIRSLLLKQGALEEFNERLCEKYKAIENTQTRYEKFLTDDAEIVIVAYGLTSRIARHAVKALRKKNKKIGLIRPITIWPFPRKAMHDCAKKATKAFLVVEMSCGQMVEDVRLAVNGKRPVYFYGRSGGGVPTNEAIEQEILKIIKGL
ncbi:MAG: 3-methyl-2-oxobutanoate dehydrogenase subunit VorB [Candidatus Omnitrophica bacterium]|nr:3-methyl-2-oxobutanoate dehydrogenase subunit VorB [Candidatus Omnitrophota bacterium]